MGDRIIGGYWRIQAQQGFYNNIAKGGEIESGILPPEACALVERLARGLSIDHGGFDIAMVGHYPYVFEFNRLFGTQGLAGQQHKVSEAILETVSQWGQDLDPHDPQSPGQPPLRQVV